MPIFRYLLNESVMKETYCADAKKRSPGSIEPGHSPKTLKLEPEMAEGFIGLCHLVGVLTFLHR